MNRIPVNLAIWMGLLAMASCKGGHSGDSQPTVAPAAVNEQSDPAGPDLTAEINNARSAAMLVSTMPLVVDPATRVEIQLQAALFGEAIRASKARYVLLLQPAEDELPSMGISFREFRLRVLAELASVPATVAWGSTDSVSTSQHVFPGTREPVATVRVGILSRDQMAATVIAEWSVQHADGGGMRQGVSAVWDGRAWVIDAEKARLEW
jgi:hypothetical protein